MRLYNKRILIMCDQIPFYGGASTCAYLFFKKLKGIIKNVFYINIIDREKIPYYNSLFGGLKDNPYGLTGVYNCYVRGLYNGSREIGKAEKLDVILRRLRPDIILGFNRFAPWLAKMSRASCKIVFMVSSSRQLIDYMDTYNSYLDFEKNIIKNGAVLSLRNNAEKMAVTNSDMIVCPNERTRELFNYFYPDYKGKIYDRYFNNFSLLKEEEAGVLRSCSRSEFDVRPIDLLFVASKWTTVPKGYSMLKNIVQNFSGLNICLIGELPERLEIGRHLFFISRDKVKDFMKKSKVFVSPSSYDTAPNVIFEAIISGCNVVTSRNCGNYRYVSPRLLVNNWSADEFVRKIEGALKKPYSPNFRSFSKADTIDQMEEIAGHLFN